MTTTIRQLILLTILFLTGSAGLLRAQDVSLTITFELVDESAPTVTVTPVDPALRRVIPDPIRFTFSEAVMNIDAADFLLMRDDEPVALAGAVLTQVSATEYDLDLGVVPSTDGDYVLTLPSSSDVTDLFSKPLVADASTAWTMSTTEPVLLAATTRDSDADGRIDRLDLHFSKQLRDASIDVDDFGVSDYTLIAVTSGAVVDDERIVLVLEEGPAADTAATPTITYRPDGNTDLRDLADNPVLDFSVTAADGAGPAIIAAQTATTGSATIVFSEALSDSSVVVGDLSISGFDSADANGTPLSWTSGPVDDDRIDIELPGLIDEDETGFIALSGNVLDGSGNPSLQSTPVPISDGIAAGPALISATTRDADGDGFIDGLRLAFAAPVSIADGNAEDALVGLSVDGYTVVPADYARSATTELVIALQEGGTPDSGVRPRIDWLHDGTLRSSTTGARSPPVDGFLGQDGAAPVLLAASAHLGEGTIALAFSEPISAVDPPLLVADIIYSDASGGGNTGLAAISDADGSDAEIAFAATDQLAFEDFGVDRLATVTGSLRDAAGNLNAGDEQLLREQDAQPGLDPIAAQAMSEDGGLLRIPLTGLRPSSNGSMITVQTSSSDSGLVPPPQLASYDPATRTAELHVVPVGDANGSADLRLRVSDDTGAWIERSFALAVAAVNDPPRMDAIADLSLLEDAATVSVPISGLAPGPADEQDQPLSLRAVSLDRSRILDPVVSHSPGASIASLAVTPLADATGPVLIV
ncbi:MAG: hypothetical protein ACOCXA_09380, partial [Planctomycetota bacterium]